QRPNLHASARWAVSGHLSGWGLPLLGPIGQSGSGGDRRARARRPGDRMTVASNHQHMVSAGLHATSPKGYDAASVLQAGALLAKSPGAYQSVMMATGVPVDVLRAAYPRKREPYRHVPLARPVTAEDWKSGRVGQTRISGQITAEEIIGVVASHFAMKLSVLTGED